MTTVAELAPVGAAVARRALTTTIGPIAPAPTGSLVDTHGTAGYPNAVRLTAALLLPGGTATVVPVAPPIDGRLPGE
ncbi:hypothetical protein AB0M41_44525 [Streptomyces sp. NPDC051896]|uniref:hypothetical protein n=1 Tax=Streptomyces sp. NPDC051896 TaxID=3155416 RepID=UPI0034273B37